MSWLNNLAIKTLLTIDGTDYSNEFLSGQISDLTAVNNGAVLSGGTITLAELPGETRLEDYLDNKFSRGKPITIDLEVDGVIMRHPRGSLFITDSVYNAENRTMEVTAGCLLTMHSMSDNIEGLRQYTSFTLPDEAGFLDLAAAILTEGDFIWVDKTGTIQKTTFFEGDGMGSEKAPAAWVSVRDYTSLASSPLGSGVVVPDTIEISYTWNSIDPDDTTTGPDGNPYDEDLTTSTYWLEHPANLKKTQTICTTDPAGKRTCRNVAINDAKQTFSVTKEVSSRRNYGGPGGSTSTEIEITTGPAVEIQGAYFAELYAYDLARADGNGDAVNLKGLDNIVQQRREKIYEYGSGGEVVKTIDSTYKNMISAMTQNDWRSGGAETQTHYDPEDPPTSAERGFLTEIPSTEMFLSQQVTTKWTYYDDRTIEEVVSLQSSAQCNGVGIYPPIGDRVQQDIDATNNGVETSTRRNSRGGLLNPDQPTRNPGGAATKTFAGVYVDESTKYTPTSAGSIRLTSSVPWANDSDTERVARERAALYAATARKLIEGDAAGIRVAESMRPEIFDYCPGMPFSFWDTTYEKLIKLRMNATAWAFNNSQAICSTDGVFIGVSNGTVSAARNVNSASIVKEFKESVAAQATADQALIDSEAEQALLDAVNAEQSSRAITFEVAALDQLFGVTVAEP